MGLLCFSNWHLPRDPPYEKNGFYLLCSSQKNRLIPPLLFKLAFTSGPPPMKKMAFTSFALHKKIGLYLLCFSNWHLPREPPYEKNGFYLLCSSQKNWLIPPLLFKLAFTSGPPLRKKRLLPPLLFTKKSAYTSFAFQTGIYLGTPPYEKDGFYLLCSSQKNRLIPPLLFKLAFT